MEIQLSEEEMRDFCAIDVYCLKSLAKKLEETEKKRRGAAATIFRVPESIRAARPEAYQPKIISLGPFHHGNPNLQEMEEVKLLYMGRLLARNSSTRLVDYYREMKRLETQARSSYSEEIPMKSEEFIQMLMLDGCFIIQLFLEFSSQRKQQAVTPIAESALEDEQQQLLTQRKEEEEEEEEAVTPIALSALEDEQQQLLTQRKEEEEEEEEKVKEEDDPIFGKPCYRALVGRDMLRLENQLPFFVLQSLHLLATAASGAGDHKESLPDLALDFFYDFLPSKERSAEDSKSPPHHLLHLFHWGIAPSERRPPRAVNCCSWLSHCGKRPPTHSSIDAESVPCATQLKAAGVNFERNKVENNRLLDVDFHYSCEILGLGVLRLTKLPIYDQTEDIFRNLIALEQCSPGVGSHVTTYAVFMDCIIDTPADVALLHREGLVVNGLGNDEDAAAMFNGLCKEVVFDLDSSYLSGLFRDVGAHCESRTNRWRAMLMQDYFTSPWSFLSLVGALIILSLTVVQTAFAVRSYFYPPPQPPS